MHDSHLAKQIVDSARTIALVIDTEKASDFSIVSAMTAVRGVRVWNVELSTIE